MERGNQKQRILNYFMSDAFALTEKMPEPV